MGWSIFSLAEIVMRMITGPLAMADNSTFAFMALLSFFSYMLLALVTGSIVYSIISLVSDRWFPPLRRDCFHIASAMAVMIFLHGILFTENALISEGAHYTSLLFYSGVFFLCFIVFLITYRIFSLMQQKSRMIINYVALASSLNIFVEVGLYGNQSLIPRYFRITAITDYAILLTVSITFYFWLASCS